MEVQVKRVMHTVSQPGSHSLAVQLRQSMADLPFFSAEMPGIGGVLKTVPEHFQVEEILPYSPCGEGEHVYVTVKRSGWNTVDVAAALGKLFHLKHADIGWGGRKDKQAVTIQTFSLRLPMNWSLEMIQERLNASPFEIKSIQRHRNKIKTGHVAANRFKILLSQTSSQDLSQAQDIGKLLLRHGIPNFYGEQRFGHELRNLDRAAHLLGRNHSENKRSGGYPDKFIVSALQSALFNIWLKRRIERGDAHRIIAGDLVKKCDTGGLFTVDNADEVQERLDRHAVIYTGPIFGYKMMAAMSRAAEYEFEVLKSFDLELPVFKSIHAAGSRRTALLFIDDLHISPEKNDLQFCFTLPSGAYATTVMREFMR